MFKPGTVFIVGAGASAELDMPFGDNFKSSLSEKVNFQFTNYHSDALNNGDHLILQAFRLIGEKRAYLDINDLLEQAWDISNALPLVSSIDSYVEMHSGNKNIERISKLAIIRTILMAEKNSKLYFTPHEKREFSLRPLTHTWLAKFTQILISGVSKAEIETVFDNISIICFNYDRCIEQFLALALEYTYSIEEADARKIVKKLKIYHPYGTVGDLPWQDGNVYDITFGKEIHAQQLLQQCDKIKTYSEQTEEKNALNSIKQEVKDAKTLIFLGMAYHKQNLDLLKPEGETKVRSIYGTSKGISDSDTNIVSGDLRQFLDIVGKDINDIRLKSLTCSEFFDEFRRTIAQ